MQKLTEKQKLLAVGGGALGICLIAGGGVFWANGLIEELQQALAQKRTEIAAAEQKIAKIPTTENEVIILRENLSEYVKILPEEQGLEDFVKVLNQLVQQSGVETIMFQPTKAPGGKGKNAERFERIEYVYEMNATLWQFIRFINFIENYERFVSISDFSIGQAGRGGSGDTRGGDEMHFIKLSMETYTYNSKSAGQDVEIPDYEAKRGLLREEIFKRMQAIRIDKYEHKGSRGRRDIFVDPREKEGRADGPPIEQQRAILDRFIGELQEIRTLQQRRRKPDLTIFEVFELERRLKDGIERMEAAVAEVGQKQQIVSPQLRVRWVKEIVEPLADMKSSGPSHDPRAEQDPYLAAEEIDQLIESMRRLMDEDDLEGADARFESISPRLLVPEEDPRHARAVAAKALHMKVKIAMEFKAIDMRIQGVLVNHEGGRSGLLLNGEVFEEGDYVNDELMLRRVEEEQVWFVFKGLTLIRTL